jgi:glycosidase
LNEVLEYGSPASSVQATWMQQARLFPEGAEHMLISDDHDERRGIVRYGERGALAASALVFTLPGVPMLYNGMEVGDATPSGAPALFSKLTIDWSAAQQERAYPAFYHALIQLRAGSPALRHGSLQWLRNSDEQHVVSFERRSDDDTELVTVNLSNTPFHGSVEVETPLGQRWAEASLPQRANDHRRSAEEPPPVALPSLSLDAFQVRIFRLAPTKL